MSEERIPARKSRGLGIVVAIAGSVLGVGLLALLLLPSLMSVAAAKVVEDPQAFLIGTVAEIEPVKGWSVQPAPREGVLLKSPDRVLSVTLRPAMQDDQLEGRVLRETLSNGAELSHVAVEGETIAKMRLRGGGVILVEAEVAEPADPARYRAELAELLLHVKPLG